MKSLRSVWSPLDQRHLIWSWVLVVSFLILMVEARTRACRQLLAGTGAHSGTVGIVVVVLFVVVVTSVIVVVGSSVIVVVGRRVIVVVVSGVHAVAPGGEDEPGAHGRHVNEPVIGAKVFAGQRLQVNAPSALEKLPAGQLSHNMAPDALENVPGRQGRQGSLPVRLNDPGAQAVTRVVVVVVVTVVVVTSVQIEDPGGAVVPG